MDSLHVNALRMVVNVVLAALLFLGGAYLLGQEEYLLRDRWNPEEATLFHGTALHLLSGGLFLLGAFSSAIAFAWWRGTVPMPHRNEVRPHPAYKGMLITQFWYLMVPAVLLVLLAFATADRTTRESFRPTQYDVADPL